MFARTTTASARVLPASRNAVLMSLRSRTFKYCSCTFKDVATRLIALNDCALPAAVTLPTTATRESFGKISFRSCNCLPLNSGESPDKPVLLPPGQAGDEPRADRVAVESHDDGNRRCRLPGSGCRRRARRDDCVYLETHQFLRERAQTFGIAVRISIFDDDIFPFYIPEFFQTLPESRHARRQGGLPQGAQESYPRNFRRLLRERSQRRERSGTERNDYSASRNHSIPPIRPQRGVMPTDR